MNHLLSSFYIRYPLRSITIHGKKWEYIKAGKGKKTLVMLPGGIENAQLMFDYIQALENDYTVIVPTISDCDSIEELCFAINTILSHEKFTKIYLYGLSLTGLLVQSVKYPYSPTNF